MTVLRDYAAATSQPTLGDLGDSGPGRFDEVVGPDGSLRPAWKGLAELAVSLTPADMYRVDSDIARLLADDGVTYARPGDRQPEPEIFQARVARRRMDKGEVINLMARVTGSTDYAGLGSTGIVIEGDFKLAEILGCYISNLGGRIVSI